MPGTVQDLGKTLNKGGNTMQLTPMESLEVKSSPINPFHYDFAAMGIRLSEELYIMHYNHPDKPLRSAYLVNVKTGERAKLTL